jgi:hypothetical protein
VCVTISSKGNTDLVVGPVALTDRHL